MDQYMKTEETQDLYGSQLCVNFQGFFPKLPTNVKNGRGWLGIQSVPKRIYVNLWRLVTV